MSAAIKKTTAGKQKASAMKKVSQTTAVKKAVKAKVEVRAKGKQKVTPPVKVVAKKKVTVKELKASVTKKAVKAKIEVKASKTIAMPSKVKTVAQKKAAAQKPERKALTVVKSTVAKKGAAVVAPAGERFRGLKSMLIAKRDALLKEAKQEIQKYVSGENRQLVDTAIDEADWAAVEISEDINLKRLGAQRQLLNDVEECLRKVNEGSYGICEDCGEEISEKRLRVIPTATLCIDCKEQREKMAILEQESEI